jgi:hypothetical protein
VDAVIGMPQAIRDDDAINLAGAFYEALGHGKDVSTAFELPDLASNSGAVRWRALSTAISCRSTSRVRVMPAAGRACM